MLTLYYVSATVLQSWRIQKVCNKISEQLAQHASIAFYTLQPGNDDGFDTAFATSELCINRGAAKVTDILWLHDVQRGCCLRPLQTVHITPWISFPNTLNWLPFARHKHMLIEETDQDVVENFPVPTLSTDATQRLQLLLEAHIQPTEMNVANLNPEQEVHLEDYGKLIAWKIDSRLAILIETDIEHFTKLLIMSFLRDNLFINDQLPLIRIESVQHEGNPQPFERLAEHLRRSTRQKCALSAEEWQRHLEDLRALSVLAQQAMDFEFNKNRTEGKAGVIKPDLIPAEKQAAGKTETSKTEYEEPNELHVKEDECKEDVTITKITSDKLETKPTEISKQKTEPVDNNSSRFRTTKVSETEASTSKPPKDTPAKSSELEKLAAATARKQKSPKRDADSVASINSQSTTTATPASNVTKSTAKATTTSITTPSKSIAATSGSSNSSKTTATAGIEPVTISAKSIKTTTSPAKPQHSTGVSTSADNAQRPSLKRNKDSLNESKPLNILVYSDSASARESTVATLHELLADYTYTIYPMTEEQAKQKHWLEQTALLVVCGSVDLSIGKILVDYFLHGGKVLSLCSDILHFILPNYRTAEVREHELVQFSYDKWKKVKMMHHIFCYQPSPVKKHFSTDSEESNHSRKPALVCPRSIELQDITGQTHNLDVKILGTEETWNTPSLLLANSMESGGKAVFSQVHLETNPSEFEFDESKFNTLKQNERTRLEIFADLLSKYLDIEVQKSADMTAKSATTVYQNAYFLGRYESKSELLEKLKSKTGPDNVINTTKLTIKFCGKDDKPPKANNNVLPILIHSCPEDFSTVEYFDNLKTKDIGRLVIYAPLVSSSMHVINDLELTHGIVVLPRHQTEGVGRSNNQWISPPGCAMFSIQLHIPLDSPLQSRLPLLQHIIGAAVVNTLRSHELYKVLDIGLKWPNDIYANGLNKIGGLVVKVSWINGVAIANIGCGLNLDNEKPTVCINELISEYNLRNQKKLPLLKYEQIIALIFNELERLLEQVQNNNFDSFYQLYYDLWLHNSQSVKVYINQDEQQDAQIVGIDECGFLRVKLTDGTTKSLQPDGNSFDMLKGLIVPKYT